MAVVRTNVAPTLLEWARERAELSATAVHARFPKYERWLQKDEQPTLRQLEDFARFARVPFGFLFMAEPPKETLPIPDFRTIRSEKLRRPSPDLLETIYACQDRQEWFREVALADGAPRLDFVGSARVGEGVVATAESMRQRLSFSIEERAAITSWSEALTRFCERCEASGILVMRSGIVGSQTNRKLDPDEFRGFALADDVAPLVFVNSADSTAAQMFTLAHELAHIWAASSAVSDTRPSDHPTERVEKRCNAVAAEFLAPLRSVKQMHLPGEPLPDALRRMKAHFKVSSLVILRRLLDAGLLTREHFKRAYDSELEQAKRSKKSSGGDYYVTTTARVGTRFARSLVASTLEGLTLRRDALRMLGAKRMETIEKLGRHLGLVA
jgi:Zn-dependent peptidase ImmA (M78 family)